MNSLRSVLKLACCPRRMLLCSAGLALLIVAGCGKPDPSQRYRRPADVTDFKTLFAKNCSGCHGSDGQLGPAPPLNDPLFQAIISDEQLTSLIRGGREGTLMPAFSHSQGGTLTEQQVGIVLQGIRRKWAQPDAMHLRDLPPYQVAPGDPAGLAQSNIEAGKKLFAIVCSGCHGDRGQGTKVAGALNEYELANLLSDQLLRRIIITGRPDLGMPSYVESGTTSSIGRPLTSDEIINLAGYVRFLQSTPGQSVATTQAD